MRIGEYPKLLVLFFLCICAIGIFFYRTPFPVAVDVFFHLRFARDFTVAFSQGDLIPDWDARPFGGRGTAAFRFYAPLVYYLCIPFQLLGIPVTWTIKIVVAWFILIGAYGVYRWLEALNYKSNSIIGAAILLVGPIIPAYLFGIFNLQNFCAMLLLPWVLKNWEESKHCTLAAKWCAISLGIMGWTHLPATLMAGYTLLLLAIFECIWLLSSKPLKKLILICTVAAGLFAPYAIPAISGTRECHFEFLDEFVPWKRIDFFDDPFNTANPVWGALQQLFAKITLITILGGLCSATLSFKNTNERTKFIFYFLTALSFGFLTIRLSLPLWQLLPGLKVLQYPYRWVFPIYILSIPVITSLFNNDQLLRKTRLAFGVFFAVIIVAFSFAIQYFSKSLSAKEYEDIMNIKIGYPREYLPITCNTYRELYPEAGNVRLIRIITGNATLENEIHRFSSSLFKCNVQSASATLEIVTHYDSSWVLMANDKLTPCFIEENCGLIRFNLDKGEYIVTLRRKTPKERYIGFLCFIVTLAFLVAPRGITEKLYQFLLY